MGRYKIKILRQRLREHPKIQARTWRNQASTKQNLSRLGGLGGSVFFFIQ